ncbi:MAG: DNA polymerase III subunit delta' [Proteobacteria bacterium]|nr:DNA polymerase III subunit delta' [Pseudomonadota bacterium]
MAKVLTPRENTSFVGHAAAEAQWLEAYTSKRFHHAWLITGPKGVGKATLAYRIARYLLNSKEAPEPQGFDMFGAAPAKPSLGVSPTHPIVARVTQGSHGDLFVLDTSPTEEDENKSEIVVDDVRKLHQFLGMTPAESEWRVVVVDSADQMNHNASNALLKLLEEPPAQSVIIMVSHTPGRLLPTIRSRCVNLRLNPLSESEITEVLKAHHATDSKEVSFAAAVSSGSPGLALTLAEAGALEMYGKLVNTLSTLPKLDKTAVIALADALSVRDESQWELAQYLVRYFIARVVNAKTVKENVPEWVMGEGALLSRLASTTQLDSWLELWEKSGRMLADVDRINMGKKHTAIALLEAFREAAA